MDSIAGDCDDPGGGDDGGKGGDDCSDDELTDASTHFSGHSSPVIEARVAGMIRQRWKIAGYMVSQEKKSYKV